MTTGLDQPLALQQPGSQSTHPNLQHWLDFFCSSAVTEASLGVIQPLSAEEACGFLGCMVVETGEPELNNLDVVEAGSGAGRGAMQYTGVRRSAYDAARSQANAGGIDPNSNDWQEQYFAEEYAGLHDPLEGSLIGWTHVFEDRPASICSKAKPSPRSIWRNASAWWAASIALSRITPAGCGSSPVTRECCSPPGRCLSAVGGEPDWNPPHRHHGSAWLRYRSTGGGPGQGALQAGLMPGLRKAAGRVDQDRW